MRYLSFLLLLLIPLAGCFNNCGNIQCDIAPPSATFRLFDGATGANLLFGPSARYKPDSLVAYVIRTGSDTVHVRKDLFYEPSSGDSLIYVDCAYSTEYVYLQLSPTDVDTLRVGYVIGTGCCASPLVADITYNGTAGELVSGVMFNLRKN